MRLFAAKRIKKVPVVENGKLVGALSRRNIMRSLVEAIDLLESRERGNLTRNFQSELGASSGHHQPYG
ncbi:MAG: CBS domain-containing protein [Adlercreutzia equolifaciens]